jgi:hypothetical protein
MDFDELVEAIERLVGIEVAAVVSGPSDESAPLAILGGLLASHHDAQRTDVLPTDLQGEAATSFRVGEHWGNVVTLWPSRFLHGDIDSAGKGVTITTADGTVHIYPNRPWID